MKVWILISVHNVIFLSSTAQIGSTESELKKLAEENPELKDAYILKQRRLKVNVPLLCNSTFYQDK